MAPALIGWFANSLHPEHAETQHPMRRMKNFSYIKHGALMCCLIALESQSCGQGGVPLWTNRYSGPVNSDDRVKALAVDVSGNVFVMGGLLNNVNGYFDYNITIKYSNEGVPLWTNRYDLQSGSIGSMVADANGNVFVTGRSAGGYSTIAYSNAGVPLWTNVYHGPGNQWDYATAMAVDSSGNVSVTGNSSGANGYYDYATIKYSGAGTALWTNRYSGPGSSNHFAVGLAVDAGGNLFVTGFSVDLYGSSAGYETIKYSNAGMPLWTNRYNGPINAGGIPTAIAMDGSGNVLVTGYAYGGPNVGEDYATVKYSSAGVLLWAKLYNGPGNRDDEANSIAVDSSGNVFVTGFASVAGGSADYATLKYSNAGVALWTNRFNGLGNSDDISVGLVVDRSGNLVVTGRSYSGMSYDYATLAYSSLGVPLWTNRYSGNATSIALDGSGNVFVSGYSGGGANGNDYATIKYSSSVSAPRLNFQMLNNQLVLNWTNAGFNLQFAPVVTGPFTNLPAATSPFTNPLAGPQKFFRLIQN